MGLRCTQLGLLGECRRLRPWVDRLLPCEFRQPLLLDLGLGPGVDRGGDLWVRRERRHCARVHPVRRGVGRTEALGEGADLRLVGVSHAVGSGKVGRLRQRAHVAQLSLDRPGGGNALRGPWRGRQVRWHLQALGRLEVARALGHLDQVVAQRVDAGLQILQVLNRFVDVSGEVRVALSCRLVLVGYHWLLLRARGAQTHQLGGVDGLCPRETQRGVNSTARTAPWGACRSMALCNRSQR